MDRFRSEPVVQKRDGRPPNREVVCLDCGFRHDAHGITAEDAIQAIAGAHESSHRLIALAIDYTASGGHPLYAQEARRAHPEVPQVRAG